MKENKGEIGPKSLERSSLEKTASSEMKVTLNEIPVGILSDKIFDTVIEKTDIMKRVTGANTLPGDTIIEKVKICIDALPQINIAVEIETNKANFAKELKSALKKEIERLSLKDSRYTVKGLSSEFYVLDENEKNKEVGKRQVKTFADRTIIY